MVPSKRRPRPYSSIVYRRRLVTGSVWLRTTSDYKRRLVTGSAWLRTASGYRQRLVTDRVWVQAASGYGQRLVEDAKRPGRRLRGSLPDPSNSSGF